MHRRGRWKLVRGSRKKAGREAGEGAVGAVREGVGRGGLVESERRGAGRRDAVEDGDNLGDEEGGAEGGRREGRGGNRAVEEGSCSRGSAVEVGRDSTDAAAEGTEDAQEGQERAIVPSRRTERTKDEGRKQIGAVTLRRRYGM